MRQRGSDIHVMHTDLALAGRASRPFFSPTRSGSRRSIRHVADVLVSHTLPTAAARRVAARSARASFVSRGDFVRATLWSFCLAHIMWQLLQQREPADRVVCGPFVLQRGHIGHGAVAERGHFCALG